MANDTGIHSISELLDSRFASDLAVGFGFETIQEILAQDLAQWSAQVAEQLAALAMITVERQGLTGSSTNVEGTKVDEFGSGKTKVSRPGSTVAFPLDRYAYATGWTSRYMRRATVADFAIKTQQTQQAYLRDVRFELRTAIYTPTNRSVRDIHTDNQTLAVKALLNADGTQIPDSPQDGSSFDGATHTHYLAEATFSPAGAQQLLDTVFEHSNQDDIRFIISKADAPNFTALTPADGWVAAVNERILEPERGTAIERLNRANTSNRYIGSFAEADVWVKPYGLANYTFAFDTNAPRPLAFRQEESTSFQGLQLSQTLMLNPLTTDFFEALFGVGVFTRTSGAVMQHNNGTYQNPTIPK